ncbi:MAG: hypothetical protein KF766_07675 [Rhodocyclaceae bacterium]|nr:hypothetical protein [Rhodocyclaceae bacterium]
MSTNPSVSINEFSATIQSLNDLLPIFSTSLKLVKSAFEGRSGHEEAVHGRADHRVPQAG